MPARSPNASKLTLALHDLLNKHAPSDNGLAVQRAILDLEGVIATLAADLVRTTKVSLGDKQILAASAVAYSAERILQKAMVIVEMNHSLDVKPEKMKKPTVEQSLRAQGVTR